MATFPVEVQVQLHPQNTTIERYRSAWQGADALGVDSIRTCAAVVGA